MEATPGDTIWDGWRDGWISLTSEFRRTLRRPQKMSPLFFDVVFIFRRHFGRQLDSTRVAFIGCNIEASRRSASKLPTCQDFVDLRNLIYRRPRTRIIICRITHTHKDRQVLAKKAYIQKCMKIHGWARLRESCARARVRVTQPSPRISLHICTSPLP